VIRATSSNGKKAECSVLVYVPVENVSIEALGLSVCDEYTMTVGDKLSFCAMIEPCNSDLQSEDSWSVSGDGVLDIQVKDYGNAVIAEALKEGQAVLTYSVDSHTASVTVSVIQPGISDIVIPDEYEYTGKAIVPKVVVKSGENVLKEGVDYSLKFRNNVNAYTYREGELGFYDANGRTSAPSVTVTGKGNYTGTFTNYFIIRPKKITDYDINVDEATLVKTCNGKARKLVPVIKWGSIKLTNKDYTISYPDHEDGAYTKAGRYSVVVTGKNNYTGTLNLLETILNKDLINISKCKISGIKNAVYSGEPIVQSGLSVKYKNSVLVRGKDYILAYRGNISAGNAKVVITGIGEYCGTVIKTFKITGTSISKAVVTGGLDALTYTGDSLTPKLTLTYKDKLGNVRTLIEYAPSGSPSYGYGGTTADRKQADYKVEYDTNIKSGSGKVIITGLNGYTGKVTGKFKINKAPITGSDIDVDYGDAVPYRKGGAKPTDITVIRRIGYEETKLTEGKDYTIVCYNNKSVNTGADQATAPYFLIKGKGEYSGTTAVKDKYVFSITQTCIDSVDISVPDVMYKNKPGNFISKMTIKDVDGKTLKADTDYDRRNAIYYLAECAYVIRDKGESAVRLDAGEKLDKTDTVVIDEDNANGVSIRICFDGLGNYGGVAEREYRIVDKSIASAKLAEPITRYYTGEEITLSVDEIRLMDGNAQISSENYEIVPGSYKKNVNKGTASVTVRGISGYGGTKTINFKIVSRKISEGGILDFLRR
jgi:hypothetical protein